MRHKLLLCLIVGGLSACASASAYHQDHPSRAAELHEKYIGGHLYRAGRHIHHHPEWQKPSSEGKPDKKE